MGSFSAQAIADLPRWWEAWQGIAENPVRRYFELAGRRALDRRSRRAVLTERILMVGTPIMAGLLAFKMVMDGASWRGVQAASEASMMALITSAVSLWLVWGMRELNSAVMRTLGVLSAASKRDESMRLDDLLCLTALTPQEVVLGAALAPLRKMVMAALTFLALLIGSLLLLLERSAGEAAKYMETMAYCLPLTLTILLIQVLLACALTAVLFITLGRGLKIGGAFPAASFFTLLLSFAFLIGTTVALVGYSQESYLFQDSILSLPGSWLLWIILLFLLVHALLCAASSSPAVRKVAAGLGPAIVLPVPVALMSVITGRSYELWNVVGEGTVSTLWLGYLHAIGCFAPVNLLTLPSPWCLGLHQHPFYGYSVPVGWDSFSVGGSDSLLLTWYWPLLSFCASCVLLVLLLRHSVVAVEARRAGRDSSAS